MNPRDPDIFFGLVLFVLLSAMGVSALGVTSKHRASLRLQARLFLISIAIRFATSIVVYEFGLVQVLGDEDSSGWMGGAGLMQTWVQRGVGLLELPGVLMGAFAGQHRGYQYMLGGLFYITSSPARLPAAALNCFFGALTVVFAFRIASSLFSPWVAARVGWLACFFPSMIIWSAQTVKEPIVILLESVALYGCVHLKLSGFSLKYILLCALAIVLVIPFRFYAAYIAGAVVVLSLALPQIGKKTLTLGSAAGVVALVIPLLMMSGALVRHEAELERFNVKRIETFKRGISTGEGARSGVSSSYDLKSTSGFAMAVADGGAHLLLAPFPWEMGGGSLRMLLTLPEVVVWYWLFFAGVLPGAWYVLRNRFNEIQPVLLFSGGLGLLYSVMFGNIGLTYRQRTQLLPWLFILACVGLEWRMQKRQVKRAALSQEPVLAEAHPQMIRG